MQPIRLHHHFCVVVGFLGWQLAGVLKQKRHARVHCKSHRPARQAGCGCQGICFGNEYKTESF